MAATIEKLKSLSNVFYNEGLERAQVRDMTGAVDALKKSLQYNKDNIDARNLLGLVYYESGEAASALTHWVISKNLEAEENLADYYMDLLQRNPGQLETISTTIKKFNIALNYCRQDSLDLAVIQLKKVLSLNPKFIKAHLLLALLYLKGGNWEKARVEARKVIKLDSGNTTAKRYLKEANSMILPGESGGKLMSDAAAAENDDIIRYNSGNEMIIQPVKKSPIARSNSIWGIVLGTVLGVAVACFLILPQRIQSITTANQEKIAKISEESDAKSAQIVEYEHQIQSLQDEIDKLGTQVTDYEGVDSTSGAMNSLMKAVNIYMKDPSNIAAISEALSNLDLDAVGSDVSPEFTSLYGYLMSKVGTDLAATYYDNGYEAYKNEDYENAIINLSKAYQFDSSNVNTLFYLGNAYYNSGDNDKAKEIFDAVITNFPDTQTAQAAETKIAEINNSNG